MKRFFLFVNFIRKILYCRINLQTGADYMAIFYFLQIVTFVLEMGSFIECNIHNKNISR